MINYSMLYASEVDLIGKGARAHLMSKMGDFCGAGTLDSGNPNLKGF